MLGTADWIREGAQMARLAEALPRWLKEIPLYRRVALRPPAEAGSQSFPDWFSQFPACDKRDIGRGFPGNFLREGTRLETLLAEDLVEIEHTSGTSTVRTPLLLGQGWWNVQEERALRLNPLVAGVLDESGAARRVTINAPACNSDICYTGRPSRADRVAGNTLHVNLSKHPFLWDEAELARMAGEIAAWAPRFLDVDPVYGAVFARHCLRHGISFPSVRFVLSSYEFPSVLHRRMLTCAFGVPVFNLYGTTETGHLMMEDELGRLRPSWETAFLEVTGTDADGIGELLVSTLTNEYMPLVRYRSGDLVEKCEEPYFTGYAVHGRARDALRSADNRRVTARQIDECFGAATNVLHYQLSQSAAGGLTLRWVPLDDPPDDAGLDESLGRLEKLFSASGVTAVERTDLLLAEPSGKFRLTRRDENSRADRDQAICSRQLP